LDQVKAFADQIKKATEIYKNEKRKNSNSESDLTEEAESD
jgi:hypothetical protein